MNAEIIAVGTELLGSRFADTNSLWLTERLEDLGVRIVRRTVVGDQGGDLEASLRLALAGPGLVLVGGGLGPTGDDRTREAAAAALGVGLSLRPDVLASLESLFRRRGRAMAEPNRRQAYVLDGADVLANDQGTAPGQWLERDGRVLVLLPGPPHEMKGVFETGVAPRLLARTRLRTARRLLRTTGLGESEVESRIEGLYPDGRDAVLTVLASPGRVDLRVAARASDEAAADARAEALAAALRARLGDAVYAESEIELAEVVLGRLADAGATLATAESCTGGLVGHRLTSVPGSSRAYAGGYVVYSNAAKVRDLGVPAAVLERDGAVSETVARAMAEGARARMGTDWAVALTGIAGPGGGTPDKPVGLVHLAVAGPDGLTADRRVFFGGRGAVKRQAAQRALDLLRRRLSGIV